MVTMRRQSTLLKLLLAFLLFMLHLPVSQCQTRWDANTYPNPTTSGFRDCKMRTQSVICDPDEILNESDRNRIQHELQQLERRTEQRNAPNFCQKKGVTAALALAKHVKGGSAKATKDMANAIKRKWQLDEQCQKSVVLVLITEDHKFWTARDDRVPVLGNELTEIFNQQKELLQKNEFKPALMNMIRGIWETALNKQIGDGLDGSRDVQPTARIPKISTWLIVTIVVIVIPILCCCCICYCCCCRNKGGGDVGGGGGGAQYEEGEARGGRDGAGLLGRFGRTAGLGTLAGMAGGMLNRGGGRGVGGGGGVPLGNLFSRRGKGGGTSVEGQGQNQGQVQGQGGSGLYPSKAVADEGGGGSWAK